MDPSEANRAVKQAPPPAGTVAPELPTISAETIAQVAGQLWPTLPSAAALIEPLQRFGEDLKRKAVPPPAVINALQEMIDSPLSSGPEGRLNFSIVESALASAKSSGIMSSSELPNFSKRRYARGKSGPFIRRAEEIADGEVAIGRSEWNNALLASGVCPQLGGGCQQLASGVGKEDFRRYRAAVQKLAEWGAGMQATVGGRWVAPRGFSTENLRNIQLGKNPGEGTYWEWDSKAMRFDSNRCKMSDLRPVHVSKGTKWVYPPTAAEEPKFGPDTRLFIDQRTRAAVVNPTPAQLQANSDLKPAYLDTRTGKLWLDAKFSVPAKSGGEAGGPPVPNPAKPQPPSVRSTPMQTAPAQPKPSRVSPPAPARDEPRSQTELRQKFDGLISEQQRPVYIDTRGRQVYLQAGHTAPANWSRVFFNPQTKAIHLVQNNNLALADKIGLKPYYADISDPKKTKMRSPP